MSSKLNNVNTIVIISKNPIHYSKSHIRRASMNGSLSPHQERHDILHEPPGKEVYRFDREYMAYEVRERCDNQLYKELKHVDQIQ